MALLQGCAFAPVTWPELSNNRGTRVALQGYLAHATGGYYMEVATLCPEAIQHDPKRCIDLIRSDGHPVETPYGRKTSCVVVRGTFEAFDGEMIMLNATNDVGVLHVTQVGRCKQH